MSINNWIIKKLWYVHKMTFSRAKMKWTTNIRKNMDESQKHYDKWNKSDTKNTWCVIHFVQEL